MRKNTKVMTLVRWDESSPAEIKNISITLNQLSLMNDMDTERWVRCKDLGATDGDSTSGSLRRLVTKGFAEVSRSGGPKTPNLYRLTDLGSRAKDFVVR